MLQFEEYKVKLNNLKVIFCYNSAMRWLGDYFSRNTVFRYSEGLCPVILLNTFVK